MELAVRGTCAAARRNGYGKACRASSRITRNNPPCFGFCYTQNESCERRSDACKCTKPAQSVNDDIVRPSPESRSTDDQCFHMLPNCVQPPFRSPALPCLDFLPMALSGTGDPAHTFARYNMLQPLTLHFSSPLCYITLHAAPDGAPLSFIFVKPAVRSEALFAPNPARTLNHIAAYSE